MRPLPKEIIKETSLLGSIVETVGRIALYLRSESLGAMVFGCLIGLSTDLIMCVIRLGRYGDER